MAIYKEFIDHIRERTSTLDQKARMLNGRLKRAINALSRDPKAAPEGPLGLKGLMSLSEAIRETRNGHVSSRTSRLIQEMNDADKQLAELDAQINQDLLAIHTSIMEGGEVPEAEAGRLKTLFTRWQEVSAKIDAAHASLTAMSDKLDQAIESADLLSTDPLGEPRNTRPAPPPDNAEPAQEGGRLEKVIVEATTDELMALKNLLVSIMGLYLHRKEFNFHLPCCCARVAACKLARVQSPAPVKFHKKPLIRDAVRVMERRLALFARTGEETNEDLALFSSLVTSCRNVYCIIPESLKREEPLMMSRYRAITDNSGLWSDFLKQGREAERGGAEPINPGTILTLITGYERLFLSEILEPMLRNTSVDFESASARDLLDLYNARDTVRLLMKCMGKGFFYTRGEVEDLLHKFYMDDFILLIPPANFAHDIVAVTPLVDAHRGDDAASDELLTKIMLIMRLLG